MGGFPRQHIESVKMGMYPLSMSSNYRGTLNYGYCFSAARAVHHRSLPTPHHKGFPRLANNLVLTIYQRPQTPEQRSRRRSGQGKGSVHLQIRHTQILTIIQLRTRPNMPLSSTRLPQTSSTRMSNRTVSSQSPPSSTD